MNKYFILAAFLLPRLLCAQQPARINDKRLNDLDTALIRAMKTWNTEGFAVAVVEKNKVVYARGFGYRDAAKKLPVDAATVFPIGSCTKAFTASLIGLLQQDGKVDIDKPAHQYFNELNFYSADLTNNITLRDMMSHRTGLPRHDYSWYIFPTNSRDSLLRRIEYLQPSAPLRRVFQYNNFMFIAQGAMIEKITGKTWEDNLRQKILGPLQMNSTDLSVHDMAKLPNISLGYGVKSDTLVYDLPYYDLNAAAPAGGINSNVLDMGNWLITWINGGKFGNRQVLSPDFSHEAISSQMIVSPNLPSKEMPDMFFMNYGFGWFLSAYRGHYRAEHGGNIDGFTASTCFYPSDSVGIVVLSNQDNSTLPSIVRNIISDRLLHLPYFDWNDYLYNSYRDAEQQAMAASKSKISSQIKGTHPSHPLQDYEGSYTSPGYGSMEMFVRHDSLMAQTPNKLIYLMHYHYDVFEPLLIDDARFDPTDENNFRFRFNTGTNGEIESVNLVGFETPEISIQFTRRPREQAVSANMLNEYAGTYAIGGVEAQVSVRSGKLYLFVAGQPEYELTPVGQEKFVVPTLSGYALQFLRGADHRVNAINFIQPNGTFKADKKK